MSKLLFPIWQGRVIRCSQRAKLPLPWATWSEPSWWSPAAKGYVSENRSPYQKRVWVYLQDWDWESPETTLTVGMAQWHILVLGSVLKYSVLMGNLRYSKVNKSRDNYHWKDSLLPFPRGKAMPHHRGPPRGTLGLVTRQRKGTVGKGLYCGFPGKEWAKQGRQA